MKVFIYDPEKDTQTPWENEQRRAERKGTKDALTLNRKAKRPKDLCDGRTYITFPCELLAEDEQGNIFQIKNSDRRGIDGIEIYSLDQSIVVVPLVSNVVVVKSLDR